MKYFISYKYTNNKNKDALKLILEEVDAKIKSWGDETFVLGRDVKKWQHVHFGLHRLVPLIVKNMCKCDQIIAYVDSNDFSKGLISELLISKLLFKKSTLFIEENTTDKILSALATTVIKVKNHRDISKELL